MSRRLAIFAVSGGLFAAMPAVAQDANQDHAQHDMADMPAPASIPTSTLASGLPDTPGNAVPPPIPNDHPADRYFPRARMEAARAAFSREGSFVTSMLLVDQLEYRAVKATDGYGWKAQGWYGNDYDRVAITTEGEGIRHEAPERAEISALWRHATGPWFNLEMGVRQDIRPVPERTYAVIGMEGLAPYRFEVESTLFVSNKGEVRARLGASYDLRVTQKLILQPAAEANFSLQDMPALRVGSGVERIELGARLRYEFVPEFAPYVGVHWERKLGATADYVRVAGEGASGVSAVFGLHAWF